MPTRLKYKKPKICLVCHDYHPFVKGGVARIAQELVRIFSQRGIDFKIIIAVPKRSSTLQDKRIIPLYNPLFYSKILGFIFFNLFSLPIKYRLIKREGFQIIHSLHVQGEFGLSRLITNKLILTDLNTFKQQVKMPYFTSWKDKYARLFFNRTMVIWEKVACLSAKKIIAISYGTKRSLVKDYKINSDKIKVAYLGINQKSFQKTKQPLPSKYNLDKDYLLFVGRLVPRKGVGYLLEAFNLVLKRFPHLKLVLVGSGDKDYETKLKKICKNSNIKESVKFVGNIDDRKLLCLFYSNALLFVFPSLVEGFGMVLTEAMLAGNAVVAFNIDAVNEVVRNGKTSILVPPRNVKKFAQAIIKLFTNHHLRRKMEKAAIKRAQGFTWEKHVDSLIQTYQEVICET